MKKRGIELIVGAAVTAAAAACGVMIMKLADKEAKTRATDIFAETDPVSEEPEGDEAEDFDDDIFEDE